MDKNERFWIGTTRFTNYTYQENKDWRERFKWKGCMYGLNKKIPLNVPHLGLVLVIEMNNDQNKIMGIGLIRNYINPKYKICIYKSDTNYNRYIYNSAYRKDRKEINEKFLEALELILFKGYGHYKRGQGITVIPWKRFGKNGTQMYLLFQRLFE
tara:strand:- start:86 stop:550 length:465 start_codon:yes stop_codon:yes gene_type:complete